MSKEQEDIIDELIVMGGLKEKFARRAVVEHDLTREDMDWNRKLGRPLSFVETVHPRVEAKRRADYEENEARIARVMARVNS